MIRRYPQWGEEIKHAIQQGNPPVSRSMLQKPNAIVGNLEVRLVGVQVFFGLFRKLDNFRSLDIFRAINDFRSLDAFRILANFRLLDVFREIVTSLFREFWKKYRIEMSKTPRHYRLQRAKTAKKTRNEI